MACNKQNGNENIYPSSENFRMSIIKILYKTKYLKINVVCRLTMLCRQKLRFKN